LDDVPEAVSDLVAELSAASAKLENALNPRTAASLAQLVRIMNSYYSNLIEGNNTRPKDIEKALAGEWVDDLAGRNLQIEAAAHVRLQTEIDQRFARNQLPEPASADFIKWLHHEFYRGASPETLHIKHGERTIVMTPGDWRSTPDHDVSVRRHQPPTSERVDDFMNYFQDRYRVERLGKAARILAIPAAHHRFNYIHPFIDGNGRVSRLMSHAMAHNAVIGAHGLWPVSRGLARGLESRTDDKRMIDVTDRPRRGNLDGRGFSKRHSFAETSNVVKRHASQVYQKEQHRQDPSAHHQLRVITFRREAHLPLSSRPHAAEMPSLRAAERASCHSPPAHGAG
jgi:Fic family protein